MVFRSDIDGDLIGRNSLHRFVGRARSDFGNHHVIHGQHQLIAEIGQKLLRQIDFVVLDQRLTRGLTLRFQERVSHGAADQQAVDDLAEVLDHFDLVGDLGAAQNRHAWPRRIARRHAEILQFLLHQQSGGVHGHELDHAFGGGVRAMRGAEGVVDVDVAQRGEFFGEGRVVLFFLGMEAQVLQQQHFAGRGLHGFHFAARCNRAPSSPGGPSNSSRRCATGCRLISGFGLPLGRPRCDARMTPAP